MTAGTRYGRDRELNELREQLDCVVADARELTGSMTERQFNWSPEPGKRWSAGQGIAHLNLVAGLYLPLLEKAIAEGRRRGLTGAGPFSYSFLDRFFVKMIEPPPRRKFKAPASMQPPSYEKKEETMEEFFRMQDRLRECLASAGGLHLARIKVRSPISPLVRFGVGSALALTVGHQRRHLWQAWQIRNHADYPAA
jgi:hypothetical protein